MTLDPNMFLPTALAGKAQLIPDPTNTFISQVATALGSATAATVTGPTGTTATANAVGLVCFKVVFPTGAATSTLTVTTPDAIEIVDVIVNKVGAGAGNTVQVQNTAGTAISDAIAAATDKAITRMGTCDATTPTNLVAAGGTFKVVNTFAAGSIQAIVTVVARRT
jgi:hypothetical protein